MGDGLLAELLGEDAQEMAAAFRRRRYDAGVYVFHEGDTEGSLHVIVTGRVAVRVTTLQGDVVTLTVLGPGDTFGEIAFLSEEAERTASIYTLEPVETMSIRREELETLRDAHPRIDRLLVDVLSNQVRRLTAHLMEALYVPVKKRVFRRLLDLSQVYADEGSVPLSQDDIASMAGTSRPTANKFLREAEDGGLIKIGRRRIDVLDLEALEQRAR